MNKKEEALINFQKINKHLRHNRNKEKCNLNKKKMIFKQNNL